MPGTDPPRGSCPARGPLTTTQVDPMRTPTHRRTGRPARNAPRGPRILWLVVLALVIASCSRVAPSAAAPAATASAPVAAATASPAASPAAASGAAAPSPSAPGVAASPTTVPTPPPTTAPSPGSVFTLLRMARAADPARPAPDAGSFVSSFAPKAPAMYVVFALQPGVTGTVVCTVEANGARTAGPLSIAYGPTNSWGDFKITSRGTFVAGSYRATVTFSPTGESATVAFDVR